MPTEIPKTNAATDLLPSANAAAVDSLEALLHKCHRAELLPLAALVGVKPDLGLATLAKQCAIGYRRKASHGLDTVTRGGQPKTYEEIIRDLARDRKLPPGSVEETELAVVRDCVRKGWAGLTVDARRDAWKELGLDGEPPDTATEAMAKIEAVKPTRAVGYLLTRLSTVSRHLGSAALVASLTPIGCLFRPIAIPLAAWWFLQPDERVTIEGALQIARLRQSVIHRVTIGVIGSPSTGKDAAIKALFGLDTGNVSPIAGSTKEVAIQRAPGATALYLVNTPGMGDVVESVTEEARQVLDHIDVYLYLINAEGGVQAREKADYSRCVATGKPVLAVMNKIDVLRPRDKDKFLADARQKLGVAEADFVAVAFDPLPELSPTPINREAVRDWLVAKLTLLGKDPAELPALEPPRDAPTS
jgi:GTP-binding protein EngB required for normal cell division